MYLSRWKHWIKAGDLTVCAKTYLISVTYLLCLEIVQDVGSCRWVADVLWDDHNYADEESWYLLINATWSPAAIGRQSEMPPHKYMKLNLDLFVFDVKKTKTYKVCMQDYISYYTMTLPWYRHSKHRLLKTNKSLCWVIHEPTRKLCIKVINNKRTW